MLSTRCKMAVREELKKLGLHFVILDLGEVEVMEDISSELWGQLRMALLQSGLELMDDKKGLLIQKIKNAIIEMVYHTNEMAKTNVPDFLSKKTNQDYRTLSILFSKVQGMTIEKIAKQVQEYASTQKQTDRIPDMVFQLENICLQACQELEVEFNRIKNTRS